MDKIKDLYDKVKDLKNQIEWLNLTGGSSETEKLVERIASVEGQIKDILTKESSFEANLELLGDSITSKCNDVKNEVLGEFSAFKEGVLEEETTFKNSVSSELSTFKENLSSELNTFKNSTLESFKEVNSKITTDEEKIAAIEKEIEEIEANYNNLKIRVSNLENRNVTYDNNFKSLNSDLSSTSSRIDEINNRVVNLEEKVSESSNPSLNGAGIPIGSIFWSTSELEDSAFHLADGSVLSSTGMYATFYAWAKKQGSAGKLPLTDNATFDAEVSKTGSCGKYVVTNTTVRLPKIVKFVQGASTKNELGNSLEAGLPNITGYFTIQKAGEVGSSSGQDKTGGAFYKDDNDKSQYNSNADWRSAQPITKFDASRSSAIYGKSSTVQPPSTQLYCYIVVANNVKTDVQMNIDKWASDLNLKQDKLSALPVRVNIAQTGQNDTVVDYYLSSDGTTWYRKWASGWKECGGTHKSTSAQTELTLPISFANMATMTISTQPIKTGKNYYFITSYAMTVQKIHTYTITSGGSDTIADFMYKVEGY